MIALPPFSFPDKALSTLPHHMQGSPGPKSGRCSPIARWLPRSVVKRGDRLPLHDRLVRSRWEYGTRPACRLYHLPRDRKLSNALSCVCIDAFCAQVEPGTRAAGTTRIRPRRYATRSPHITQVAPTLLSSPDCTALNLHTPAIPPYPPHTLSIFASSSLYMERGRFGRRLIRRNLDSHPSKSCRCPYDPGNQVAL